MVLDEPMEDEIVKEFLKNPNAHHEFAED